MEEKKNDLDVRSKVVLREAVRKAAIEEVGPHYVRVLREEKIRSKKELDRNIEQMLKNKKGLILSGEVGVGKTTDLVYIIQRIGEVTMADYARWAVNTMQDDIIAINLIVSEMKHRIKYYFAPELFNLLHQAQEIEIPQFFIIDDIGRQYTEPFALSRFEALIEKMYRDEKTLIMTTNLTREAFLQLDGWGRITDRTREMCNFMKIDGNSMRHK